MLCRRIIPFMLVAVLFSTCVFCAAPPQAKPEDKVDEETAKTIKEYEDAVKDHVRAEGLVVIYSSDEKGTAFLELNPEVLGKKMLCSVMRTNADGSVFDSSSMMSNFAFSFEYSNGRVQMVIPNTLVRSNDPNLSRSIERSFSDSIFASAKAAVKQHPKTKNILVSLNDLLLADIYNLTSHLNAATSGEFGFDKENSRFSVLKTFPENVDIEATLHFKTSKSPNMPYAADNSSVFVGVYYSFRSMPESDYVPRYGDERVGYFLETYQDYTSYSKDNPHVFLVHRWDLRKKDPEAAVSEPVKPIVYWLQNTIPVEYRDSVRRGLLAWNEAFEKAGFKNAIVVEQQPDDADWDPADIRYNTVCWIVKPLSGYAVGPSHANPYTGELYDADIRVSGDIIRFNYINYSETIDPLGRSVAGGDCDYAAFKGADASFCMDYLAAMGEDIVKDVVKRNRFVNDYITDLIIHEVGHTLGLRHNFKASSAFTMEQLADPAFTKANGISASVMDYNPANIVLNRDRQGEYFQTRPGIYDDWAIEYGYKPVKGAKTSDDEKQALDAIASRAGGFGLEYGTDEDASDGPDGLDPYCRRFDQSSDHISYFSQRLGLADAILAAYEKNSYSSLGTFQKVRRIWNKIFWTNLAGSGAVRLVGGMSYSRLRPGDDAGRAPFAPVPAAKQREAVKFICDRVFAFRFKGLTAELANKLAPERISNLDGGNMPGQLNPRFHQALLGSQESVFAYLYHPLVLERVVDTKMHLKQGEDYYGIDELFSDIYASVWTVQGQSPDEFARALQKRHLDVLTGVMFSAKGAGYPADAVSLARAEIADMLELAKAGIGASEGLMKAHFADIKAKAEGALEARVEMPK